MSGGNVILFYLLLCGKYILIYFSILQTGRLLMLFTKLFVSNLVALPSVKQNAYVEVKEEIPVARDG